MATLRQDIEAAYSQEETRSAKQAELERANKAHEEDDVLRKKKKKFLEQMAPPWGGKSSAPGFNKSGPGDIPLRTQRAIPASKGVEDPVYDSMMNRHESELQDIEQRMELRRKKYGWSAP